jgi:CHAT domain-containing protein/tetratricopeptide (TPR) repeat protein
VTRDEHIDAETLAAFVDGALQEAEVTRVLSHLDHCPSCRTSVEIANQVLADESPRDAATRRPAWWLAMAAALAILLLAVPAVRIWRARQPIEKLVALAPRTERRVEPRITGGFAWAEYGGVERSSASNAADPQQLKLAGAAGELVERAARDDDAEAQHAAGVAMLLIESPSEAVTRLEKAVAHSNDPKRWSDLAAARYAVASKLGQASLYTTALAAADTALRADPNLAEARFNRALILERLGLTDEARRAWQRYLEIDASSPWASEARARLAALPESTRSSEFEQDRPSIERAAGRGDSVRDYVSRHRDRTRAFAEGQYLGEWGDALRRGDVNEAARWLRMTRGIGDALFALSGEAMPRDAVAAIDRASEPERRSIAEAHQLYRRARIAYNRGELEAANADLLRASALFDAGHDPMGLMARYYVASVRLARNDTAGARTDLERARIAADLQPAYVNLGAQVRWELGRARMLDSDWSGAADVLTDGAALFRRAGARGSGAFVEILLAQALASLGREDDAWLARTRAFAALSAEGPPAAELLAASVGSAMHDELLRGRRDAALALSGVETAVARVAAKPSVLVDALANRALLLSAGSDSAGALAAAREADGIAASNAEPALRGRMQAVADVAMGAALAESDPAAATKPLSRAIDFYAAHDLAAALPEPLLLRARCAVRMGDATAALLDLERGMSVATRHEAGAGVLDAEHALFTDAIRLALDRGDDAAAFVFAERSRGATFTLAELQQRLAGSETAVLEIVALPDELVTFAIAENDVVVGRRQRSAANVLALTNASLSEAGTDAAAALYDDVIRPVDAVLSHVRELVIVADPQLQSVPFAALYDRSGQRHLIERFTVSVASSAGSLQREASRDTAPSLVAIALPSGGAASDGLPEAEQEVREVAALYKRSESIPASEATLAALTDAARAADVVHIAGHTERLPGGGEQALLFAGARVSWKTILGAPPVQRGVVVLAACETLRPPGSVATRALSLGGAFSAAGATDVIGTLAPIGDRDARLLFGALHGRLAAGLRPAVALREAMLEAINRDKNNGGRRAWRAVALLTRRTPAPQH